MKRSRRLAALRARAERGSTEGERAAARRALAVEEGRVESDESPSGLSQLDHELGEVEPGEWAATDRDGRGTRYQVRAPDIDTARDWFSRGAMCILRASGVRFVGRASGFSLPNAIGGPAPLAYFVRWRDLPSA